MRIVYLASLAAYVGASGRYWVGFARSWPGSPVWGAPWIVVGVGLHGTATVLYTRHFGHPPLVGLAPSLATLSLLLALALALLTALRAGGAVGLFLAPVAALLLGLGSALGIEPAGEPPAFRASWLLLHIVLSFIGYAGLVVAAAASLMYLLQFRQLKRKRFGAVFQFFPDLETLDRINGRALLLGFAALTLGLLVGWVWSMSFGPSARWNPAQLVWGVLTWVVFVAALGVRAGRGWAGRRSAWLSVVGFGAVVLAYLVLKLNAPQARLFL